MDLSKIKGLAPVVDRAVDVVVFQPDEPQRRAKSNFWAHFATTDTLPPDHVSLATALKFGGDRRISQWWDLPGFQDWFSNKDEFRQRVEFLADLALDELYGIIKDKEFNGSAKVAAIKMLMEMGKKLSSKSADKDQYLDEKVSQMSKEELEKFIRSRTAKLLQPEQDKDNS
jgi:hypothetical protein